ncbi:hypothetical protein [Bacillus thuringiensis]|uniref:hypothetical protein n=1 Tax=Bacillus thuringiensis TaxID=1428 RepID=UPI000BF4AB3C|nr:hypothetical protein [Bacillus thuringiensis]MED3681830.1 hypothetical protein [Bacillus thuringiensis]PFT17939.1 hypothetical protein COK84_07740 [Bacillus thuringiensis]
MKKQYITQTYIDMLRDKEQKTGVFGTPPRVIRKGEKYRKTLSVTQKFIYEELWELTGKAVHKGQLDERGRAYIEISYAYIAVACDISEGTARNILKGTGKYNQLFKLGLLSIKKRKDRETSEYYVMAPSYEGIDEAFLTNDITPTSMVQDAKEIADKKNRKKPIKRKIENEQLKDERMFDTRADNAEYEQQEKQLNDGLPNGVVEELQENTEEQPQKEMYFRVIDKQDYDGNYRADYVITHNGKVVDILSIREFLKRTKSTIDTNRHDSSIMKDIESQGKYEIRYEVEY